MGSAELAITLNRSVAMGYKIYISAVALALVIAVCNCQFAPSWKQSPYIEAKTIAVVSSASKTYGAYT
jgi:PBP1b-binding outer membrane lipoprotein LpoB